MMPQITERPSWMSEDLDIFRDAVAKFFERECVPKNEQWMKDGQVDKDTWRKAGEAGLLLASTPVEYGGAGGNFTHEAIIIDELCQAGVDGFGIALHNAIVAP
jgi:acyl-CoA dehydrogenase